MAMHPALIAGRALSAKSWREAARGGAEPAAEPNAEPVAVSAHVLDTVAELRSLGHVSHRLATLCGACSITLLWLTNWLGFAASAMSLTTMVIGIGSALLAVLLALAAFGMELLTRVRIETRRNSPPWKSIGTASKPSRPRSGTVCPRSSSLLRPPRAAADVAGAADAGRVRRALTPELLYLHTCR